MLSLPVGNWVRLFGWLIIGLVIYFAYGRWHSHLGRELREEISKHGVSPAGMIAGGPAVNAADGETHIQPARDKERL
jgi:hypothetical protein